MKPSAAIPSLSSMPELEVLRFENARLRLSHRAIQTALQTVLLLPWYARLRFLIQGARMFAPPPTEQPTGAAVGH